MTTMQKTNERTFTNRRYLDAIDDHVVIFDGAMGTSVQSFNLTAEDYGGEALNGCIDYLVITRPDVIEQIHASFLAVGSEVVETDTFRGNRWTLAEYGLGDRTLEINRTAAQIARRVCDRFEQETGIPRFVAGSMGPSGKLPSGDDPDLSNVSFEQIAELYYEQAQGLVEGGADGLVHETQVLVAEHDCGRQVGPQVAARDRAAPSRTARRGKLPWPSRATSGLTNWPTRRFQTPGSFSSGISRRGKSSMHSSIKPIRGREHVAW